MRGIGIRARSALRSGMLADLVRQADPAGASIADPPAWQAVSERMSAAVGAPPAAP